MCNDEEKNRKFQLLFVMILRITKDRKSNEAEMETHRANIEMSVKVQLRSGTELEDSETDRGHSDLGVVSQSNGGSCGRGYNFIDTVQLNRFVAVANRTS